MDIPSYLLGKKASGGSQGTPTKIIEDNSSVNPFVFENYEPGIYMFKPADYIYLKALNSSNTIYTDNASKLTTLCLLYYVKPTIDTPDGTVIAEIVRPASVDNSTGRFIYYDVKYLYNSTKVNSGLLWTSSTNVGEFDYVSKAYNQTITGKKTFNTLPESSVIPTTDNQLVNKKYVDDNSGDSYTAGDGINISNGQISTKVNLATDSLGDIFVGSNVWNVSGAVNIGGNSANSSSTIVGKNSSAFTAPRSVAIGNSAEAKNGYATALGANSKAEASSIALGYLAQNTKSNQVVFGGNNANAYINEASIYTSNGLKVLATEDYVDDAIGNIDVPETPFTIIDDNSEQNPFILSEHEPGAYYFKNMQLYGLGAYLVYCKVTPEQEFASCFGISPNAPYFYYTNKLNSIPNEIVTIGYTGNAAYKADGTFGISVVLIDPSGGSSIDTITGFGQDLDMVTKGTVQTISAKKTFSVLPESSAVPTTDNQLVNKKYVDDNAGGGSYTAGSNIEITNEGVINNTIPFSTDLAHAITLGRNAYNSFGGIAIGAYCRNESGDSIAIGDNARAGYYTVALGDSAKAQQRTSIAIGAGAETQKQHQMMIGGSGNDKYISEVAMYTANGVKVLATEDYVNSAIATAITSALGGNY